LRLLVGRDKSLDLYGPAGFIENVYHKLQAYHWNLVDRYLSDFIMTVHEIESPLQAHAARFRLKNAFAAEPAGSRPIVDGVICDRSMFRVSTAVLDHHTPCLGFAIEEADHVNVWKNRLAELGLPVGSWLYELKQAVIEDKPADHSIQVRARPSSTVLREMTVGDLKDVVTITAGQKIGYVTDVADTASNRTAIVSLVRDADVLFIEATFARSDAALAQERAHLTTAAAGEIAREAGVRRVEPFHLSTRYAGQEEHMLSEVMAAFAGTG